MTQTESTGLSGASLIGIAIILVAAYFLSVGPFIWLKQHDYLPDPIIWFLANVFYVPLQYTANNVEFAQGLLSAYIGLWL